MQKMGKLESAKNCYLKAIAITYYQTACYNKISQSHPTLVEQNWNSQNTRAPNFIIIGAQKSEQITLINIPK